MRTLPISLNYQKHHGRTKRETQRGPARLMLTTTPFVVFIAAIVLAGTWAIANYTGFVGAIGYAQGRGDRIV